MSFKNAEKSSISKIKEYLKEKNILDKYLLEDQFVNYLMKYNKNKIFEDKSIIFNDNDKKIFCPITIEKNNNKKYFNYLGNPIKLFFLGNIKSKSEENIIKYLENYAYDENIKKISFCVEKKEKNFDLNTLGSQNNIDAVYQDSIINLESPEKEIFKGFSKGHKSEIKKNKLKIQYNVINFNNYHSNLILQMMELHKSLAGKQTRSLDSWLENEKMIIQKKGFMVCVKFGDKIISYSFFFHDHLTGVYFSSCTDREYFKYAGITHNSIWEAIRYLKNIGCKYFYLGKVKTHYSKVPLSTKEVNIERFKKSFGGINRSFVVYNKVL